MQDGFLFLSAVLIDPPLVAFSQQVEFPVLSTVTTGSIRPESSFKADATMIKPTRHACLTALFPNPNLSSLRTDRTMPPARLKEGAQTPTPDSGPEPESLDSLSAPPCPCLLWAF